MSEMLERVAMAIANASDSNMVDAKLGWDACDASMKEDYRTEARAAIAAMREPTNGILDDLDANNHGWGLREHSAEIWRELIDIALQ